MLYPADKDIKRLRENDPYGRKSNSDIEREALHITLREAVEVMDEGHIKDIFETIVSLLPN